MGISGVAGGYGPGERPIYDLPVRAPEQQSVRAETVSATSTVPTPPGTAQDVAGANSAASASASQYVGSSELLAGLLGMVHQVAFGQQGLGSHLDISI